MNYTAFKFEPVDESGTIGTKEGISGFEFEEIHNLMASIFEFGSIVKVLKVYLE